MIEIPLIAIISGALTIGVRLSGLMLFAPFFGSMVIPARIKAALVLALTLALYPAFGAQIGPHTLVQWPLLIFNEFLVGVGMGIATNVVFEAIELTGSVLGIQMGYSLVNILDPQTQVDTPVVAMFYQCIAMLLFLGMDVHLWLLRAVGNSFRYVPPERLASAASSLSRFSARSAKCSRSVSRSPHRYFPQRSRPTLFSGFSERHRRICLSC